MRTLYALFAVSGFCGLIYESIWSHYLKLFLGHAAYAQTVVLVVFIGGLALGSWLAGSLATRLKRPLRAYAVAEFIVGFAALVFHGLFVGATDWAYAHLLPATCSAESLCWTQWLFAGLMILPQSILLGTTFPFMTGGILRLNPEEPGRKLSLLYFLNSIGAVAGVLASGFVLIPTVGLPGTLFTAGILNILLATVVYLVDARSPVASRIAVVSTSASASASTATGVHVLLAIALLTGLSSFIYEVAWIRSLSLVLGGATHSFELMLASFILGIALGGFWVRKRIDRVTDVVRLLAIVQLIMGAVAVLTLPLYSASYDLMEWVLAAIRRTDGGWVIFNLTSTVICLVVMLPATLMAGMTLPLITYALLGSRMGEKSIGHVYAANTLGGILGVILAVYFALPVLGLKGALVLGGAIDVALGAYLLLRSRTATPASRFGWSAAGIACVALVAFSFHLDPLRLASSVFRLGKARLAPDNVVLYHRDGRTATVDVYEGRTGGTLSIATNGKVDGSISLRPKENGPISDEHTMLLSGALPLAHKPDAKQVAIIGLGTGMTTAMVLQSPRVERVDTIEIEPAMVEGARLFSSRVAIAFSDPRSHIVIDDAKSYFARNGKRYDVIVSEPSNPWVSGVSSLFTREFYARIRGQLNEGGLLVQWVNSYAFNDVLLTSVVRGLRESFPEYVIYATTYGDLVLVASPSGPVPALSAEVFSLGKVGESLAHLDIRRIEDLRVRRVGDSRTLSPLIALSDAPANSDYFPLVDTHAAKARFLETAARGPAQISTAPWPLLDVTASDPGAYYPLTPSRFIFGDRTREAHSAELARRLILGEPLAEDDRRDIGEAYTSVLFFKIRFIDCRPDVPVDDARYAALVTASLVNPYLSREAASQVWDRVRSAPCYRQLEATAKKWIDLFAAVGRRDADASATLAMELLDQAVLRADIEYLYGAAMTAYAASGRVPEARRLFARIHPTIPPERQTLGWFRWFQGSIALWNAQGR